MRDDDPIPDDVCPVCGADRSMYEAEVALLRGQADTLRQYTETLSVRAKRLGWWARFCVLAGLVNLFLTVWWVYDRSAKMAGRRDMGVHCMREDVQR